MGGQTKFCSSELHGCLELSDEVNMQICEVNTAKRKMSAVGRQTYYNQSIEGSGLLGVANSVKVGIRKQLEKV